MSLSNNNQVPKAHVKWNVDMATTHRGYSDAAAGIPWNSTFYDKLSPPAARNYERGRLAAVQMLACGITPPKWKFGQPRPASFNSAWTKSQVIAGTPHLDDIRTDRPFTPTPTSHRPHSHTLAELGL